MPERPLAALSELLGWRVLDVELYAPGRWLLTRETAQGVETRTYASRDIRSGQVFLGLDPDTGRTAWLPREQGRPALALMHAHVESKTTPEGKTA